MVNRNGRPVSDLAKRLGLSDVEMAEVVTAHTRDEARVVESMFLLYFRLLNKVGRDPESIGKWLRSFNDSLNGHPIALIKTSDGYGRVIHHLGKLI